MSHDTAPKNPSQLLANHDASAANPDGNADREGLIRVLSWATTQSYHRDPDEVVAELRTMLDGWAMMPAGARPAA